MREAILVGAGGFGREALDVVEACAYASPTQAVRVIGVVDDAPSAVNLDRLAARGYAYLGGLDEAIAARPPGEYLLGVGAPAVRRRLVARLDGAGWQAVSVVHPAAVIGSRFQLGAGALICGGVQVSTNVTLGRHVHLNPGAIVGHDAILRDFVSVNPGAVISGEVDVGDEVLIGASAVVLQGLVIGARSVVGAASCVTRDVAPKIIVKGVPAR